MNAVARSRPPIVVKFGGELLDDEARLNSVVRAVAAIAAGQAPLVVVHGGGKEIDAALAAAGIRKQQVEGLRITDDRTLDVVVAVVAGSVNTRFVAALNAAGVRAVGLTGADARCGLAEAAPPHRTVDGGLVDLGRVGVPIAESDMGLLRALTGAGFVPVLACIGLGRDGRLLNVNADTFAGHLAASLGASRLVIAGTTAGVLGEQGKTLPLIEGDAIDRLINDRTATAGMIAKLRACEHATANGVAEVVIADGGDRAALEASALGSPPDTTTRILARNGAHARG